jgi:hypothetical protein
MLVDLIHSRRVRALNEQVRALTTRHYLSLLLAGTAGLASLLYWLAFVQPYGLIRWQHYNQMDLQRMSISHPDARWYLLAALIEQGIVYILAWRMAQAAKGRAAWGVVFGGSLLMSFVLLFMFPFGADDIFDNIMHGRMIAVYGANPFVQVIAQYARDPIRPYVGWPTTPSAYGPAWELMAGGVAWLTNRLSGASIVANVLAFKALGVLFFAGSVGLVAAILRRLSPERALTGTLLLAWNPVVLYETMGNGHNDIVMVFFILAAAWALLARRHGLAILALVAGALIKFIPVLLIPAAGLIALRELADTRARLRFVILTGALALLMIAAAYAPFWEGTHTLGIVRREKLFTTSLPAAINAYLSRTWDGARAAQVISRSTFAWTVLFALGMGFRAFWDRSWYSFTRSAVYTLMFYLLLTCLWFQNWYALWPLALAVLLPPGRTTRLAHLLAFAALAKPYIFVPMFIWPIPTPPNWWRELRLGPAVMAAPWAYALYNLAASLWNRVFEARRSGRPTRAETAARAAGQTEARPAAKHGLRREPGCAGCDD